MTDIVIPTERLLLVGQTPQEVLAFIETLSPADRAQVSDNWLARVRSATAPDPWTHGFVMRHRQSGATIGSCGFKGPPTTDGMVEIAYGVDPEHQCQGHATEAAQALAAYAFRSSQVRLVIAHTLPEANASTRVLTKCGFRHVGEVIDPEDGLVWRWEKRQEAPGAKMQSDSIGRGWRAAPILGVRNVRQAAEYYRDVLGFSLDPKDGVFQPTAEEPGGVYAIVKRSGVWIHFQIRREEPPPRTRSPSERDIYLYVEDLDALYAEFQRRGAVILQPPRLAPYGLREITVEDLNGYRLDFGEPSSGRNPDCDQLSS